MTKQELINKVKVPLAINEEFWAESVDKNLRNLVKALVKAIEELPD